MRYLLNNLDDAWALTIIHLRLSLIPILLGLLIAVPLGALVQRTTALRRLTTITASIIFTIPSLALFVVLPLIIPTRILDEANVIVALTLYTVALLVRAVPEALDAVSPAVLDAATAVGYRPLTRMLKVELPLAIPVSGGESARRRSHQHLDGGGRLGDRHRRAGHLVHRGLPVEQERSDHRRNHRDLRAGDRHRHVDHDGRPAHHPVDTGDARRRHGAAEGEGHGRGGGMNFLQEALSFIFTAANWAGPAGLGARILEHLQYTVIAVFFSALIAIPIGMIIGHTGRGTFLVVTGVNALRALPTLGVLLLGVLLWGLGLVPPTVALMLLGIPPLLAGTYAGIANVDRAVVDAARSMGMTEPRVLLRVEVPNAMPLILGGLRTATLQIVATATVAAYASLGGLGRYLIDGIKVREFYLALVGALMVTALALILDGALAFAVWASVPGSGRLRSMPQPLLDDEVALESAAPSKDRTESSFSPGYERGGPSPTVDG